MAQDSTHITPRATDYSAWYLDVIAQGDLLDDAPVRGCKVLKPHGYGIWENIQRFFDQRFKDTGHVNAYFPLFIPLSFLAKEAEHVEGFAKECAVVTHHRLRSITGPDGKASVEPDPDSRLEEPLIVRPTSETIIWHMYGRWIDSWRDLPILINQWANVVRWEMKTRPFLRTAEFLWQEGHTAHATAEEAIAETEQMLDIYAEVAEAKLAVPVIKGRKSARERFAGAVETYTIEAMMQNGWALQAGTSHFLGQNFAKAFDVTFQTREETRDHVWATSWGVSTRLIGAVIMCHSDDQGLVLPPEIAPVQVVIVPVGKAKDKASVMEVANALHGALKGTGFRVRVDDRDNVTPGAKFFEWERKGVPLRLELGPRDIANGQAFAKRRTGGDKFGLPLEGAADAVREVLDAMQVELLERARARQVERTRTLLAPANAVGRAGEAWEGGIPALGEALDAGGGFFLVPWGGDDADEDAVKEATKATLRCFPLEQPSVEGLTCPLTGKPSVAWAIFARAY